VDRFLGRSLIGMGEDGQAAVEKRDLLFIPDDLEFPIRCVAGFDQVKGSPSRLLGLEVESCQTRGQDNGRRQEDLPPAGLHRHKDHDRGGRADDGGIGSGCLLLYIPAAKTSLFIATNLGLLIETPTTKKAEPLKFEILAAILQ
jgi:hypothetical protein